MSGKSVREKFSVEFASASPETVALQNLIKTRGELPELVIFDPDAPPPVVEPVVSLIPEPESYLDPVEELRMLFGSVA